MFKYLIARFNVSRHWLPMLLVAVAVCWAGLPAQAQTPFDCSTVTDVKSSECEALVALYNETDGPNWTNNDGWLESTEVCTWAGVSCTNTTTVSQIILSSNNLVGELPDNFGNLTGLTFVSMFSNQLSGPLPASIDNLVNLTALWLPFNELSGNIPEGIGDLSNLQQLLLYNNRFEGPIPASIGDLDNLTSLRLSNNQFKGDAPATLTTLAIAHDPANNSYAELFGNSLTFSEELLTHIDENDWLIIPQTVPPTTVDNEGTGYTRHALSWTVPDYAQVTSGNFPIGYREEGSSDDFTFVENPPNKTIREFLITGLDAGTAYEFCVQMFTPAGANPNPLTSDCTTALASTLMPDEMLSNGDFANDAADWTLTGLTPTLTEGVLALATDGANGTLTQDTGILAASGEVYHAALQMGNTSPDDKQVQVAVRSADADETAGQVVCNFIVPGNTPLLTYELRGPVGINWDVTQFELTLTTEDTAPNLLVDDISLMFAELDPDATTECTAQTPPADENTQLLVNGDFESGDLPPWQADMLGASVNAGVLELNLAADADAGTLTQTVSRTTPENAPFELLVDLGNTATQAQNVVITLSDTGASGDNLSCMVSVPAGADLQTTIVRGQSSDAWEGIAVSFGLNTEVSDGALLVDNAVLQYQPGSSYPTLTCLRVAAPDTELIENGGFNDDLAPWMTPSLNSDIVNVDGNDLVELTRETPGTAGNLRQEADVIVPADAPLELVLQLGNTASVEQNVRLVLTGLNPGLSSLNCTVTVPANAALQRYVFRAPSNAEWEGLRVAISLLTDVTDGALQVDNVSLQYKPDLNVTSVQCLEAPPANVDLLTNGSFDAGFDTWDATGLDTAVAASVLELNQSTLGTPGTLTNDIGTLGTQGEVYVAEFSIANPGTSDKAIQLAVRGTTSDAEDDWAICPSPLVVPAATNFLTYTLSGPIGADWDETQLALTLQTDDGVAPLQIDTVTLTYRPDSALTATECTAETPQLQPEVELLQNGDFASGALPPWVAEGFDDAGAAANVMDETLGLLLPDTATMAGRVYQDVFGVAPSGSPFELTMQLGNPTPVPQTVKVMLTDETEALAPLSCTFTLLPTFGELRLYQLQGSTAAEWNGVRASIALQPAGAEAALQVDDVSLQYLPDATFTELNCEAPDVVADDNLLQNGDFEETGTLAPWVLDGFKPIQAQVGNGVLKLILPRFSGPQTLYQDVGGEVPEAGAPFEVMFRARNPMTETDQSLQVRLGSLADGIAGTEDIVCSIFIRPDNSLGDDRYYVRGLSQTAWENLRLTLGLNTAGATQALELDDITLIYQPSASFDDTQCLEPIYADLQLLTNGNFEVADPDAELFGWEVGAGLEATVENGTLQLSPTQSAEPATLTQAVDVYAPIDAILDVTLSLSLSADATEQKDITVALSAFNDTSGGLQCTFAVPPDRAPEPYILRGLSPQAWEQLQLSLQLDTLTGTGALQIHQATLQYRPGLREPLGDPDCIQPTDLCPLAGIAVGLDGLNHITATSVMTVLNALGQSATEFPEFNLDGEGNFIDEADARIALEALGTSFDPNTCPGG